MHCKITLGEREIVGGRDGLRTVLIDSKPVGTPPVTSLQNAIVTLYMDTSVLAGGVTLVNRWDASPGGPLEAVYGEAVYMGAGATAETALSASEPKTKKEKKDKYTTKSIDAVVNQSGAADDNYANVIVAVENRYAVPSATQPSLYDTGQVPGAASHMPPNVRTLHNLHVQPGEPVYAEAELAGDNLDV
jgi:hypothetical protein